MRNTIPDDYIVFLQEHENTDGLLEGDPIKFHQAMQDYNSKKWINAMIKSISLCKTIKFGILPHYLKVRSPLVASGYL